MLRAPERVTDLAEDALRCSEAFFDLLGVAGLQRADARSVAGSGSFELRGALSQWKDADAFQDRLRSLQVIDRDRCLKRDLDAGLVYPVGRAEDIASVQHPLRAVDGLLRPALQQRDLREHDLDEIAPLKVLAVLELSHVIDEADELVDVSAGKPTHEPPAVVDAEESELAPGFASVGIRFPPESFELIPGAGHVEDVGDVTAEEPPGCAVAGPQ